METLLVLFHFIRLISDPVVTMYGCVMNDVLSIFTTGGSSDWCLDFVQGIIDSISFLIKLFVDFNKMCQHWKADTWFWLRGFEVDVNMYQVQGQFLLLTGFRMKV